MKKYIVFILILLAPCLFAADKILTTPKPLIVPEAAGIRLGFEMSADTDTKSVRYSYYFLDSNGSRIYPYAGSPTGKITLVVKNWDSVPVVSVNECIGNGDPHACCTGAGTGTCDDTFLNANCVGENDPLDCCTSSGDGICQGWDDVKTLFGPIKTYLDAQIEKVEGVEFE